MRSSKQPARNVGNLEPVGTAGRYYITFNPYSNAYQVSRRLPSYVRKEDLEPEMWILFKLKSSLNHNFKNSRPSSIDVCSNHNDNKYNHSGANCNCSASYRSSRKYRANNQNSGWS